MGDVCGVTSWGVNCECIGELLVGIPWQVVLPSGCTGVCESVGAVDVPCPHCNELPGKFPDSIVSDVVWLLLFLLQVMVQQV